MDNLILSKQEERELILLAYQSVTMTSPTAQIINVLTHVGLKRTLEVLLVMQQSPNKVRNPEAFLKKAISQGWNPTTLPIKKERNIARYESRNNNSASNFPSYNWLKQD